MRQDILVVEDEPAIAESVAYALRREGFAARVAGGFQQATAEIDGANLVILDLMLPDGSGLDLIRLWRERQNSIPIIVLSSRDEESDRVLALEAGADDYVTKPFSLREILARVRAVLRRSQLAAGGAEAVQAERAPQPPLLVDPDTRKIWISDRTLELTRVEFDLLSCLLKNKGRVYTRAELIDMVWGSGFKISDRIIDSHVKSLRRKTAEVGGDPGLIETVRGVGYRINTSGLSGDES